MDALESVLTGAEGVPGLVVDTDLEWTIVTALAAGGRWTDVRIAQHLRTDDTAAGQRAAATAKASRPTPSARRRRSSAWWTTAPCRTR